jgi:hypothetical protein
MYRDLLTGHFHTRRQNLLFSGLFSTIITRTAVEEIAHLASHPKEDGHEDAKTAMECIRKWKITPMAQPPLRNGYAENFSDSIRNDGLLPLDQRNDGKILAEASLEEVTYLMASDSHLTKIDRFLLKAAYEDKHLHPVDVVSKKDMLRSMKIKLSNSR